MSAFLPLATIERTLLEVCFVPTAEVTGLGADNSQNGNNAHRDLHTLSLSTKKVQCAAACDII